MDPLNEQLVKQARLRGVNCRLLVEDETVDGEHEQRMEEYQAIGVEVCRAPSLPMKLALFDGRQGMIALLDPVITKPSWTSLMFDHIGFSEAMKGLFEDHWRRATELQAQLQQTA